MARLTDADGIDGPFERAMRTAMREDAGTCPDQRDRTPLTADTITDEQIRELWRAGAIDSHQRNLAINTFRGGAGETWRRVMRARCAELINARAKEAKQS